MGTCLAQIAVISGVSPTVADCRLMNVARQLDKGDRISLTLCAEYLIKHKQYFNAAEVYTKIGDVTKLAMIYVASCQWQEVGNYNNEY